MALVNHSFTALINTDPDGDNTIAAQAITVKVDLDLSFAVISENEDGSSPITQPGAVTDSDGVLNFWVAPGIYQISDGTRTETVIIDNGSRLRFDTVTEAKNSKHIRVDDEITILGRDSGKFITVLSSGVTANTFNIIESTADPLISFVLMINTIINLVAAGALADDATDIKAVVEVMEPLLPEGGSLFLPSGNYFMSGDGAALTKNTLTILGEAGTFLRAERTYFLENTPSAGKHVVGQGNIFNGEGLTGTITLKNITLVGAYDEAWGDQDMANGTVPHGLASKLLFFHDCGKVVLNNVKIKNSFNSNSALSVGGYADDVVEKFGWNAILISECDDVQLIYCDGVESCGEAWHVYSCGNVDVFGSLFENDFGVSFLDVTFCRSFHIAQNRFRKLLASDSGELLNVASSNGIISGNSGLNGNFDIGNEYINRGASLPLAKTFVLRNQIVSNNNLYNGHITMSTQSDATDIVDWVQEDVLVSKNIITIDLDTRPAADGSTVLNYTGVALPQYHDARNIVVDDNIVLLKGALQTIGANPHLYNNIKLIDCIIAGTGVIRKGVSITRNKLITDLSNYDPDDINDLSGAIIFDGGSWENTVVEDNPMDSEMGIYIGEFDDITKMSIKRNKAPDSEFFLNAPFTAPADYSVDGIDISDNEYTFKNTPGHTYTTAEANDKGFGYFVKMEIGAISSVDNMTINRNIAECAAFVYVTNFQTTTSSLVDAILDNNKVKFVDYALGTPTYHPLALGRTTGSQTPNGTARLTNNYFTEDSTSTVLFNIREVMAFELMTNTFVGAFDIDVQADATVAGVPESRLIIMNNVATIAFDIAVLNLDGSAVTINVANNVNITSS